MVNLFLKLIHSLLTFVDGFALQGRSVKAPETYELFKSIGNMYKKHTSRFQVLGAYFIFYWFPLVILVKFFPKSLDSFLNHWSLYQSKFIKSLLASPAKPSQPRIATQPSSNPGQPNNNNDDNNDNNNNHDNKNKNDNNNIKIIIKIFLEKNNDK